MPKSKILPRKFYQSDDVLLISQQLLGKVIVTQLNHELTSGIIVETEAYYGIIDKACHAYNNRRTNRTEIMYAKGGVAYVYLCYGLHSLLNFVTANIDVPHAILIRAIEPLEGIETMLRRRGLNKLHYRLTQGPGSLTQALGINRDLNGASLTQPPIWVEDRGIIINKADIIASPRVGIDYAQEFKEMPWRFRVKDNPWTSKGVFKKEKTTPFKG